MFQVGIWTQDSGIPAAVREKLPPGRAWLRTARHPAELSVEALDLLVVAPGATAWAGAGAISSRTVLLPGSAGPLARALRSSQAVSYGPSPKDTLTLSSLEGERICLALQREIVTLEGAVLERQELVLPFSPGGEPLPFLAVVGALLLLGVAPETLMQ